MFWVVVFLVWKFLEEVFGGWLHQNQQNTHTNVTCSRPFVDFKIFSGEKT